MEATAPRCSYDPQEEEAPLQCTLNPPPLKRMIAVSPDFQSRGSIQVSASTDAQGKQQLLSNAAVSLDTEFVLALHSTEMNESGNSGWHQHVEKWNE